MEMTATGDVDVTQWVPPLAHCLPRDTLSSHFSACRRHRRVIRLPAPLLLLRRRHGSPLSGEFRLLSSLLPPDSDSDSDLTDLHLALRLLFSLQASLPSSGECCDRIGGFLTNWDKMGSSDGRAEEVKLLSLAREMRGGGGDGWMEEAALTNAVGVMAGDEGRAIGAAVYPPGFSWFNHSCSPNACYRFEMAGSCHCRDRPDFLVVPDGEDEAMIKNWGGGEMKLTNGKSFSTLRSKFCRRCLIDRANWFRGADNKQIHNGW